MQSSSKNNTALIIIVISSVLIAGLIVLIFRNSTPSQPTVLTANSADSTNDHHPKTSADTSQFSSLLGKPTPDFSFADLNGNTYTPASLKGKNVILFFNEGLMCYPACWNQISSFPKDNRFKEAGAEVISIVVDAPKDWESAVKKMPDLAAATVVFDSGKTASSAFGVLIFDSSMHKGAFPGHTYIIIDKAGVIRFALDDPNMAVNNDRLMEEIKKL